MGIIEQVVVYADVQDPQLMDQVTASVKAICKDPIIHTVPSTSFTDPLYFLSLWEGEKGDVWTYVNNHVPIMHRFECFVTDSKNQSDGAVAYALYHRRMPVLSLAEAIHNIKEGPEADDNWITATLYSTVAGMGLSNPGEAIDVFFTFPEAPGKMVTLEGECSALVTEQCWLLCDYMQRQRNMPVKLVGANGCDLTRTSCSTNSTSGNNGNEKKLLVTDVEEEMAIYAPLVDDLLSNPDLFSLREVDPQLHGALTALNRHHNLPILRYRLQRGVHVVMCRPLSVVIEELMRECERQRMSPDRRALLLGRIVKSMQHFEHHWLGLPKTDGVLIVLEDDNHVTTSASSQLKWSSCLLGECLHTSAVEAEFGWTMVMLDGAAAVGGQTLGRLHDGVRDAVISIVASAAERPVGTRSEGADLVGS